MRLDVIFVGNAIMDVLAPVSDGFLSTHAVDKGGMNLIDEDRAVYLTENLPTHEMQAGGSAANSAYGLSSLGGRAGFVGQVRDDKLGTFFAEDMQDGAVTFQGKIAEEGPATARSIILVTPDTARSMNTFLGSSIALGPQHITADLNADVLYLEGYLFDAPDGPALFEKAAEVARMNNSKIAVSLSDSWCVERHFDALSQYIKDHVDILFCNVEEMTALAGGISPAELAPWLACLSELVLTKGSDGARIYSNGEVADVPAMPIGTVQDTTGAGDLFAAGYLFGRVQEGYSLEQAGIVASKCAGEVICHFGARPQITLSSLL